MSTLSIFDAARDAAAELAFIEAGAARSFAEVAARVRAHLEALPALSRPDERPSRELVAVATDDPSLAIELLLACFERELPVLPLHARWTMSERRALVSSLPVSWLVDTAEGRARCQRVERDCPAAALPRMATPPLVALATSGSTGSPRVAVASRSAFIAAAAASAHNLGWRSDDRWLACLPLAHVGGLSVITRSLLARRPVVLASGGAGSSTERLVSALVNGRATIASLVPAQLDALLELKGFELPSHVRALLVGGAALSRRLLLASADRGWPVLTTYGLTEACSQVATQAPDTVNRGQLGCGRPLPGMRVRIRDGVIEIAGPNLFSGYLGASFDTALDAEGWFRTSDAGFFDEEGQLHVAGRIDDLIISGGENVAPWEVEAALERQPGVLEACVFAVPDSRFGQLVAAGLRIEGDEPDGFLTALDRSCRLSLAAHKRPRLYALVREFPRGPSGKPARRIVASELTPLLRPAPDPA